MKKRYVILAINYFDSDGERLVEKYNGFLNGEPFTEKIQAEMFLSDMMEEGLISKNGEYVIEERLCHHYNQRYHS